MRASRVRVHSFGMSLETEIHDFGHASEHTYATFVYFQVVDTTGIVTTSLLCPKTKVTPFKLQSIPGLKLTSQLFSAN